MEKNRITEPIFAPPVRCDSQGCPKGPNGAIKQRIHQKTNADHQESGMTMIRVLIVTILSR